MGFEQMDAYERTYINREKPEVKVVDAKKLRYHVPESWEEKDVAKKVKEHLQTSAELSVKLAIGLFIALGIVGIAINASMDMDWEDIAILLAVPVIVVICMLIFFLLNRRFLITGEVQITKVLAFDTRAELYKAKYTQYHKRYYYRVLQQETHLVVNNIRISKEEYQKFSAAKMIYLVKVGKHTIEPFYDCTP